jgi:hypothetical protein
MNVEGCAKGGLSFWVRLLVPAEWVLMEEPEVGAVQLYRRMEESSERQGSSQT